MSRKNWRNPANPEYQKPAVDPSTTQPAQPRPRPPADAVARAQEVLAAAEPGSDRYALAILSRAAEFLDEFVQKARVALKKIDPEKLAAIMNQVEPEPAATDARKRPRGAMHPILLMIKLSVGAARLLKQVIKATNPSLFTMSHEQANLLGLARQTNDFEARMNRMKAEQVIAAAAGS
jgi:hypothetical protein